MFFLKFKLKTVLATQSVLGIRNTFQIYTRTKAGNCEAAQPVTENFGDCKLNHCVTVRPKGKSQVIKAQKPYNRHAASEIRASRPCTFRISHSVTAGAPSTQKTVLPDPQPKPFWVCSSHKVLEREILFLVICVLHRSQSKYKVLAMHSPEMLLFPAGQPSSDPKATLIKHTS